jgi:hypothetical protein
MEKIMLDIICSDDFMPLLGQYCYLNAPPYPELALQVSAVRQKPLAQIPHQKGKNRVPFIVELMTSTSTPAVDVVGELRLPASESTAEKIVEGVNISRTGAMGRDNQYSYFQLIFN